jgi:hypothetical protein
MAAVATVAVLIASCGAHTNVRTSTEPPYAAVPASVGRVLAAMEKQRRVVLTITSPHPMVMFLDTSARYQATFYQGKMWVLARGDTNYSLDKQRGCYTVGAGNPFDVSGWLTGLLPKGGKELRYTVRSHGDTIVFDWTRPALSLAGHVAEGVPIGVRRGEVTVNAHTNLFRSVAVGDGGHAATGTFTYPSVLTELPSPTKVCR